MKSLLRILCIFTGLYIFQAAGDALDPKCEDNLRAYNLRQIDDFRHRYEPSMAERQKAADEIREILNRTHVIYSESNSEFIIRPAPKAGLNTLAQEMDRFRNVRLVVNMNSYTDRTIENRDDFLQASSDNQETNLILSIAFLKEIASTPDWDVATWVNNAKTYLAGYNRLSDIFSNAQIQKSGGHELELGQVIESHRQRIEDAVYDLRHRLTVDHYLLDEVSSEILRLASELEGSAAVVEKIIQDTKIANPLSWQNILPMDPILRRADIRLVPNGTRRYRVLMSFSAGDQHLSLYLKKDLFAKREIRNLDNPQGKAAILGLGSDLTREERDFISSQARVQLPELYQKLHSLSSLTRRVPMQNVREVLEYNQKLLEITSSGNRAFVN